MIKKKEPSPRNEQVDPLSTADPRYKQMASERRRINHDKFKRSIKMSVENVMRASFDSLGEGNYPQSTRKMSYAMPLALTGV